MEEITLQELFFILRKRMGLIILITVITVATVAGVTFFLMEPEYESTTTLLLGKPQEYQTGTQGIEYSDIQLNQKLISTYAEIAKSHKVLDQVKANLNLTDGYVQLNSYISVSMLRDTEIIKVSVTHPDPVLAAVIANETADVFMGTVADLMKIDNVQVVDEAKAMASPVSPNVKMNIAISLVLGLMIGVFLAFVLEAFDNSVKSPADVEKMGLKVIGMIPMDKQAEGK
jgi:capsular polysaccharide biosynthesis protein